MNKDITLEEYTNKFNRIFADKEENGFSQEVLRPLWQSLQNDDMDITFDDEIYAQSVIYNQHRLEKFKEIK
jgi:hypothetical protein